MYVSTPVVSSLEIGFQFQINAFSSFIPVGKRSVFWDFRRKAILYK